MCMFILVCFELLNRCVRVLPSVLSWKKAGQHGDINEIGWLQSSNTPNHSLILNINLINVALFPVGMALCHLFLNFCRISSCLHWSWSWSYLVVREKHEYADPFSGFPCSGQQWCHQFLQFCGWGVVMEEWKCRLPLNSTEDSIQMKGNSS